MNELERLLAAVPRPEPSDQLDQRVNALLAREPPSRPSARWRNALVWCGTTACIGLISFYCGRWSVGAAPGELVQVTKPQAPARPAESSPISDNVLSFPLRQDQLASLFVQSAAAETMLGTGPVRIEVSTSP